MRRVRWSDRVWQWSARLALDRVILSRPVHGLVPRVRLAHGGSGESEGGLVWSWFEMVWLEGGLDRLG